MPGSIGADGCVPEDDCGPHAAPGLHAAPRVRVRLHGCVRPPPAWPSAAQLLWPQADIHPVRGQGAALGRAVGSTGGIGGDAGAALGGWGQLLQHPVAHCRQRGISGGGRELQGPASAADHPGLRGGAAKAGCMGSGRRSPSSPAPDLLRDLRQITSPPFTPEL